MAFDFLLPVGKRVLAHTEMLPAQALGRHIEDLAADLPRQRLNLPGLQSIKINPAWIVTRIPRNFIIPWLLFLVNKSSNFSSQNVINYHSYRRDIFCLYISVGRKICVHYIGDRIFYCCNWIEWIRIILTQIIVI